MVGASRNLYKVLEKTSFRTSGKEAASDVTFGK